MLAGSLSELSDYSGPGCRGETWYAAVEIIDFPVVIVRIKKPWPPRGRAPGRFVSCGDHGSEQVADVVFALMVVAGGRLSPATPEGIGRATSLPVRYSIDRENFKPLMSFHVKKRNQKMVASHFDTQ